MPNHVSLATAIDKNKICSNTVYVLLCEVDVIDPNTGDVVETIYATNNNTSITWNGNTYLYIPFTIDITEDQASTPTCTLTVMDLAQTFQAALQQYGWSLAWPLRFKVLNWTNQATPVVEIQQDYEILGASATDTQYAIAFQIGAENPLTLRFPPRQQFRNRCFWQYKDSRCQYAGTLPTCDLTYTGTNGCQVHNNVLNFGGFPGITQSMT